MTDPGLPTLERLGRRSWQLVGIGIVALAGIWLLGQLWVLVLALAVAILFARALSWPTLRLRAMGLPRSLAAMLAMLGLALLLVGLGVLIVPPLADEFAELGDTIQDALDDVETWLVEDSPFDVTRQDVADLRERAADALRSGLTESGDGIVSGALLAFEIFTGLLLAVVTCFFMLKDGDRFHDWSVRHLPEPRRDLSRRLTTRAWATLGGYLRGAAILGVVEAIILGFTLWITGGGLVLPIMVITFLAAFVPFAGALVSGIIVVLVALATSGTGAAITVGIVALAVQQLDNDILAPVIYGRSLSMHPLLVLFGLVAGGALFGPGGALISVPVVAVAWNVAVEYRTEQAAPATPAPD